MRIAAGSLEASTAGQRRHLLVQPVGMDGAGDQPGLGGLGGREEPAGRQHLEGALAADVAAERHHRGRAEQAEVDAVDGEAGAVGGERQIAGGDKLAAGGGGKALDARQ